MTESLLYPQESHPKLGLGGSQKPQPRCSLPNCRQLHRSYLSSSRGDFVPAVFRQHSGFYTKRFPESVQGEAEGIIKDTHVSSTPATFTLLLPRDPPASPPPSPRQYLFNFHARYHVQPPDSTSHHLPLSPANLPLNWVLPASSQSPL